MADNQRTIEILLQFREAGEDLLKAVPKLLEQVKATAIEASAAINSMGDPAASQKFNASIGQLASNVRDVQNSLKETSAAAAELAGTGSDAFEKISGGAKISAADQKVVNEYMAAMSEEIIRAREAMGDFASASVEGFHEINLAELETIESTKQTESALQSLKSTLGRGSDADQFFRALRGAGPIAAIGIAASEFGRLFDSIGKGSVAYRTGKISLDEYLNTIAEAIPVIGQMAKGFEGVAEAITGDKAAAELAAKVTKDHSDAQKAAREETARYIQSAKEAHSEIQSLNFDAEKMNRQADMLLLPDEGRQKKLDQAFSTYIDQQEQIRNRQEQLLTRVGATSEQINGMQDQVDSLTKAIAEYGGKETQTGAIFDNYRDAVQERLDAAKKVSGEINQATEKALDAAERLLTVNSSKIKIDEARQQAEKYAGEVKKAWGEIQDFVGKVQGRVDSSIDRDLSRLQQAGKRIEDSSANPQQKYNDAVSQLDNEKKFNFVDQASYDLELQKLKETLNQEVAAVHEAAAKKGIEAEEAVAATTTGYDKMVAQNQVAYLKDLANWQRAYDLKQIDDTQFATVKQQALTDRVNADAKALAQITSQEDAFAVAISEGVNKEAAAAKESYDHDVETWREHLVQKEIRADQYNAYVIARQQQLQQTLDAIQEKKKLSGLDNTLLVDQSQHKGSAVAVDQAVIAQQKSNAALKQQYDQGLLEKQQYEDGLKAIAQESADKQLEINGSFIDGIGLGFKKMGDSVQSQAQIGEKVSDDLATSFGNTFTEIVSGSKTVGDAFKAMAASLLGDIAKLEAESAIKSLLGVIGGAGGGAGGAIGSGISTFVTALFAANAGGVVPGYATGGVVGGGPSGPDRDTMLAWLTPGEGVLNRRAMAMPGIAGFLATANAGRMPAVAAATSALQSQTYAAAASAQGSASSTAVGMPQIVAAIPATEQHMAALLDGGRIAAIDFFRNNWSSIKPRGT